MTIFHEQEKRKRPLPAEYFIKLAAILYGKVLVDACIIVWSPSSLCLPIHLLACNSLYALTTFFSLFSEQNSKVKARDGHKQN